MQYARKERARRAQSHWNYRRSVLCTVGNMTILWAGIERMLDELIAHWQHLATDLSREHPRSLSNKLDYLKTMERDARLNDPIREFLRTTRITAKRLGNERHDIIHGLLHNLGTTTKWRTQRVIYDGPLARISQRTYANDDLQNLTQEMSNFSAHLSPRVWVLTRTSDMHKRFYSADQIDQAMREFGYS